VVTSRGFRSRTYRLMTVMTLPRALSPYSSILLYTPMCSSTLTIASGVQGKMDLTVPAGGVSETVFLPLMASGSVTCDAGRGLSVTGWMKRMLRLGVVFCDQGNQSSWRQGVTGTHLWYRLNKNWWFRPSTSLLDETTLWRYWSWRPP